MTPRATIGSGFILAMILQGCSSSSAAQPAVDHPPPVKEMLHTASPEVCLGLSDKGVFPDLDPKVQIVLPAKLSSDHVSARIDDASTITVRMQNNARVTVPAPGDTIGLRLEDGAARLLAS